jgi:hypothetical protein|tara:strand:+ start:292 stop:513 length:222 start_codon:yes stop_codon:yes gene_type:complete
MGVAKKMIKARRLFLVPSLSILFLSWIPVIGVCLVIVICLNWYVKNQKQIHSYFRGQNYEQNETSDEELESLR